MTLHTILYYLLSGALLASCIITLRKAAMRVAPALLLSACAQAPMAQGSGRSADWYSPGNVALAPSAVPQGAHAGWEKPNYINYMAW